MSVKWLDNNRSLAFSDTQSSMRWIYQTAGKNETILNEAFEHIIWAKLVF